MREQKKITRMRNKNFNLTDSRLGSNQNNSNLDKDER
jgi:hypothetical protein